METLPPVLATNADAAIVVEGLTKLYDKFSAVIDLSFAVRPGEVMGPVGPNGGAKTTPLRFISEIIPPTRGSVRIWDTTSRQIRLKPNNSSRFSRTNRAC